MRRNNPQQFKKLHLIVCEDAKSSKYYLKGLGDKFGINIMVKTSDGTDIASIIKSAAKYSKRTGLGKDMQQTYCLFDKDATPNDVLSSKMRESECKGYKNAYSIPCYEYWLLLHLIRTDRPFNTAQECCNTFVETYNRRFGTQLSINDLKREPDIFEKLFIGFNDAIASAHNYEYEELSNPYTNMHKVIEELLIHKTKN